MDLIFWGFLVFFYGYVCFVWYCGYLCVFWFFKVLWCIGYFGLCSGKVRLCIGSDEWFGGKNFFLWNVWSVVWFLIVGVECVCEE